MNPLKHQGFDTDSGRGPGVILDESEVEPPDPLAPAHELTTRCSEDVAPPQMDPNVLNPHASWEDGLCFQGDTDHFSVGADILGGIEIDFYLFLERSFDRMNQLETQFQIFDQASDELVPLDDVQLTQVRLEDADGPRTAESAQHARLERSAQFSITAVNENPALEYTVEYRIRPQSAEQICANIQPAPWLRRDENGWIIMDGTYLHADALCEFMQVDTYLISPPPGQELLLFVLSEDIPSAALEGMIHLLDLETQAPLDMTEAGVDIDNGVSLTVTEPLVLQIRNSEFQDAHRYFVQTAEF